MAFTKVTNTGIGSTGTVLLQNLNVTGIVTAGFGVSTVDVFTTGITTFANATDSTSTTTGSVVVSGGVGIAGSLNVGGSVSVGGTLTYEDVTNVDSVGIITARSNILVGSGITLSPDGNIFAVGVVTTPTLKLGSGVTISSSGDSFATGVTTVGSLDVSTGFVKIPDSIIHVGDANTKIRFPTANVVSVETGGTERARINSNGKLLINHSSARGVGGSAYRQLQIEGTDAGTSGASIIRNSDDGAAPSLNLGKSRAGSVGGTTIVQSGDALGTIAFAGADGTNLQTNGAIISGEVDGTPGENDMPGRLVFKTTADGAASASERVRITSDGRLLVNSTAARTVGGNVSRLIEVESSGGGAGISIVRNQNTASPGTLDLGKSRGYPHTIVNNGDKLGQINFAGADGTDLESVGAQIVGEVDGTPGENDMPGRLIFKTTSDGNASSTERARITSGGQVLINQTSYNTFVDGAGYSQTPLLQVVSNDNVSTMISLKYNSGAGAANRRATFAFVRTADGTDVSDDSVLGEVLFMGEGNSAILKAASVRAEVDGSPGASDMPGRLVFSTTADGSHVLTERLRITSDGKFGIGTDSPNSKFNIKAGGGQCILELQRNSTNTTGNYGVINFTASDGHSVASIGAYGGGDNESGYINFKTTTSASANNPFTSTTERMRIHDNGDISVGTTSSIGRFLIKSAGNGSGNSAFRVENSDGTYLFLVRNDGLFQTGNDGNSPYNITGSTGANVFIHASSKSLRRSTSSIRYKKDITDATWGLAEVLKLRPVTFKSNGTGDMADDQTYGGFTAEDIHDLGLTEFVQYNENNEPDALSYGHMVALLTNAIKELNAKIVALGG